MGMFMFLGWATGCSFIGLIADKYGRKLPFIVCNYLCVVTLYNSTRITEWWIYCFVTFFYGMLQAGSYSVGYVFMTEQLPRSKRQYILFYDVVDQMSIILVVSYLKLS